VAIAHLGKDAPFLNLAIQLTEVFFATVGLDDAFENRIKVWRLRVNGPLVDHQEK